MARYFLPVVLILAAVTFLIAGGIHYGAGNRAGLAASFRYAAYPALSVLVVACPCAPILATPAAIIAALGRLAGTGVLIKGGGAVERLAQVDSFAFDKTGTLTEGRIEMRGSGASWDLLGTRSPAPGGVRGTPKRTSLGTSPGGVG
jgi:Cu+-exporting ATPase